MSKLTTLVLGSLRFTLVGEQLNVDTCGWNMANGQPRGSDEAPIAVLNPEQLARLKHLLNTGEADDPTETERHRLPQART